MQFVEDTLTLVDLGVSIFDEQFPQVDRGLRKAITRLLCVDRMSAIMDNQTAWKEYTENKALLRAVHLMKFNPGKA
jgi:histone acetyltransferase HTATIP